MAPARACGLFIAAVCLLAGVDAGCGLNGAPNARSSGAEAAAAAAAGGNSSSKQYRARCRRPLSAHRRLLAPPEASSPALPRGRVVSPAVYAANLKAIARDVLPRGWQLNAVQKWDAYGHGLPALAAAAAAGGFSVSVLSNREAREAYEANPRPPAIRRIMPAEGPVNYSVVAEALRRGWGVEELLSPLNEADVLRAARDAGTTIPVHIYLYNHYENDQYGYAFNASELLQAFVESLDPRLVSVRGIMMHTGGDTPEQAERLVKLFNEVSCPVAKQLAAKHKSGVMLHFASSDDVGRLAPDNGTRMQAPNGLCTGDGITWAARIGYLTYGTNEQDNTELLGGEVSPVMTWFAPVSAVESDAQGRKLARVDLERDRYPSPSWWQGVEAFEPERNATGPTQPDAFVFIEGQRYQLAEVPRDGYSLTVDVSRAKDGVEPGAQVCILCDVHPLEDSAQEWGCDSYNCALCLEGEQPVVGTSRDTPECSV